MQKEYNTYWLKYGRVTVSVPYQPPPPQTPLLGPQPRRVLNFCGFYPVVFHSSDTRQYSGGLW
jgi:hypothetical protein